MKAYTKHDLIRIALESDDKEILRSGIVLMAHLQKIENEQAAMEKVMDRGSAADQEADYSENGSATQTDN